MEQGIRFTLRDGNVTLRTGAVAKMFHMLSKKERKVLTEGKKARERAAKAAGARKQMELLGVLVRVRSKKTSQKISTGVTKIY